MKIDLQNLASQISGVGANSRIQLGKTENAPEIKTTNFFGRLWNAVTRNSSEKAQNQQTINQVLKSIAENGGSLSQETIDYMEGLATQGKPLSARRFNALMDEAKIEPSMAGDIESDSVDSDDDVDVEASPLFIESLRTKTNVAFHYIPPPAFSKTLQGYLHKEPADEKAGIADFEIKWNTEPLSGSAEEKNAQFLQKLDAHANAPERGDAMTQFLSDNMLRDLSRLMTEANVTSKWEIQTKPDSNFLTIRSVPADGKNGFTCDYLPSQLPQGVGFIKNAKVDYRLA